MRWVITSDASVSQDVIAMVRDQFADWSKSPDDKPGFLMDGLTLHDLETGRTYSTPRTPVIPAPHVTVTLPWAALVVGAFIGSAISALVAVLA